MFVLEWDTVTLTMWFSCWCQPGHHGVCLPRWLMVVVLQETWVRNCKSQPVTLFQQERNFWWLIENRAIFNPNSASHASDVCIVFTTARLFRITWTWDFCKQSGVESPPCMGFGGVRFLAPVFPIPTRFPLWLDQGKTEMTQLLMTRSVELNFTSQIVRSIPLRWAHTHPFLQIRISPSVKWKG